MEDVQVLLKRLEEREEPWQKEMLDLYDQGATDAEVMREMDLTVHQWRTLEGAMTETNFPEIVEIGRMLCRAWWEGQGRKNLHNNKFNTQAYKFVMSNVFGWAERSEESRTNLDFANMDDASLLQLIREKSEKLQLRDKTTL